VNRAATSHGREELVPSIRGRSSEDDAFPGRWVGQGPPAILEPLRPGCRPRRGAGRVGRSRC